ncbi:MAG: (2Fe-2S)-binding protein [Thermocrispum agreste]|uniref:(2Fe-2S)-binding protein n=1 Tax=Thermocrispum agreste TaxID=37925 RepID=A0A2W4LDK6_9PSEU|nr:MAG: Fe-S oxidoreductase [Thermocrispum agreste]
MDSPRDTRVPDDWPTACEVGVAGNGILDFPHVNHAARAVTTTFHACSRYRRTADDDQKEAPVNGSLPATPHPATDVLDHGWLAGQLELARRYYGQAPGRVLGTVWWYSASSVLVGQPLHGLLAGSPVDPSLDAVILRILPDGRFLDAWSNRPLDGGLPEFGRRLHDALEAAVRAVAAVSGARQPALWAVATDSIASRLLQAGQADGDVQRAVQLAAALAEAVGGELPTPRFARVGPHLVVRRASCCLIDRTPRGTTCAACPGQHPEERERRIRELLG